MDPTEQKLCHALSVAVPALEYLLEIHGLDESNDCGALEADCGLAACNDCGCLLLKLRLARRAMAKTPSAPAHPTDDIGE